MGVLYRIFFVIVLGAMLALTPGGAAQAGTLVVTNNANSGPGSLRQAIASASSGDTITFDNDYTITLASELQIIDKTITITGAGHRITISGNNAVRVFHVGSYPTAQGGNLTLDHLNIVNGKITGEDCAGSAVACGGGLMLEYLTTATVLNSTFSNNDGGLAGGAIYSYYGNPLTVTNSTFINNHTIAYAGAIQVFYGSATLTNNTFTGNSAVGYGGAILNNWGTVTFRNNIFANNSADYDGGNCNNSEGTFNDGGGNVVWGDTSYCPGVNANPLLGTSGYYGGDVPTLPLLPGSNAFNTATANCPPTDARGVARSATCDPGAYESNGFSLVKAGGDNQSAPIHTAFASPLVVSVLPNNAGDAVDGGVVTLTAPSSGASITPYTHSVTISGGAATQSVTANTILGGPYLVTASTSGASSVAFSLTNTCWSAVTVANNADSGAGSLRLAIADLCAGGTITFDPSLAGQTITLTSAPLAVGKSLTITGLTNSPGIAISGNNATRVFDISAGTVALANLTIRNGASIPAKPANLGGAGLYIANSGTAVTLSNSTLTANAATGGSSGGAAVVGPGASLTLNSTTISGNNAESDAGGIYNLGALTANSSTITGNTSPGQAGGVTSGAGSAAALRNTILAGNTGAADCYTTAGITIQSNGYNMIGAATNCSLSAATTDTRNFAIASLNLGALQNNGGPTATHALLASSPAIDAIPGCNSGPDTDQRGIARPQGANCDTGAFELVDNDAPDTTIDSHPDISTGDNNASFTFSGNDGSGAGVSGFECQMDGAGFSPCASGISFNHLADGSHTFEVRAIDRLGNADASPASFTWAIYYHCFLPLISR